MNLFSSFISAYTSLKLHKVRSGLTIFGLVIGVMSIILVMNLGQSIRTFVLDQVEVFGTDYIEVEIKVPNVSKTSSANAIGLAQGVSITTLHARDAEAIGNHPNIKSYYYGLISQEVASFERENITAMLWGVSASFFDLHHAKVISGRPYTSDENTTQARVVVIGPGVERDLFGTGNALGERIKIGNKKFTVVGVLEEQSPAFFIDLNDVIYVPVKTLQKQVMGVDHIQFILAYMHDPEQESITAQDITAIMRDQHGISDPNKDDFAVTTAQEAMSTLGTITVAINVLLITIAAISLLVAGVGITNIMYVSVSERTYEIGLRKAVGATRRAILWQFLWEAVFLTFFGGIIGVGIGTLFTYLGGVGATAAGFDWPVSISLIGIVISVGFSVIVGIVFGLLPAQHASGLEPVEALRK